MLAAIDHMMIIALSGRALARSAVRGGYRPLVLDSFADLDTCALASRCARVKTRQGRFEVDDLLRNVVMLTPPKGKVGFVYGAGLESAASLLEQLDSRVIVYGNPADVVATVNDPRAFFGLLDELSIPHPRVQFSVAEANDTWLVKRAGASGGWHVDRWKDTSDYAPGSYLQQRIDGQAMSAVFIADGFRTAVLGFNTLWTQQHHYSASPFAYGGAVNRAQLSSPQRRALARFIADLVRTLGLRGLNSLDFVTQDERCYVLELNPRPSATFSLYDADVAGGLLNWHLRSCQGRLTRMPQWRAGRVRAHSIVYAMCDLQIPHDLHWPMWSTDRPRAGTRIARGEPVCGVFADGRDVSHVHALLELRQAELVSSLERICEAA